MKIDITLIDAGDNAVAIKINLDPPPVLDEEMTPAGQLFAAVLETIHANMKGVVKEQIQ